MVSPDFRLILYPGNVTNSLEEEIIDIAYEIELKYDIIFGIVVYSQEFWNSEYAQSMPLYQNIIFEGLPV